MDSETIVCIGTAAWCSLWRPIQQTMSRMPAQYRILYFEPGRNPEAGVVSEFVRNVPNFVALHTERLNDHLTLISTPSSLPHARRHLPSAVLQITAPWVTEVNTRILIRHVRWVMQELHVKSPILWLYSPYHVDLIGKLGEKLVCYFNYDEYANYVENARVKALIYRLDDRLTRESDVVFATSRAQWLQRKAINVHTYFVPNGVDFELFNRALDPNTPLPDDLVRLPRPVIGYAGSLGSQIDLQLLNRVAVAYPNYSLALAGPDELPETRAKSELRSRANVFFLGRKEMRQLPAYLKGFDVALIPYLLVGYPLTAYPLKLHEYLAAGRAIVATAMPELRPFAHVVRIAESQEEFICRIHDAIADYAPEVVAARVAVARENTWDQRVAEISRILSARACNDRRTRRLA